MRTLPHFVGALALALVLSGPSSLSAQAFLRSFEAGVGWSGWTGDLATAEPGLRLQAAGLMQANSWLAVGAAGHRAEFGTETSSEDEGITETGFGLLVRLSTAPPDRLHLFGDFMIGWSELQAVVPGTDAELDEDGFAFGPGIGIAGPITGSIGWVVGLEAHRHRYGAVRFDGGRPVADVDDQAWRWATRVGVSYIPGR